MKRRALLSVTDKTGILELAERLGALGFEILSTGGTARVLREGGVAVTDVAAVTGFPEILDGRVKTLHPAIHGGVLARTDRSEDRAALEAHGIRPIELVVVNLYAFEEAAARNPDVATAVEEIDIGGPTLLRAAAKNHAFVLPVVDPRDYGRVLEALAGEGADPALRRALALKVFRHTARYDRAIADFFAQQEDPAAERFPETLALEFKKVVDLRYGENPHQAGAFYRDPNPAPATLADARLVSGKALSYNNLLDADSAWGLALDLGPDAVVYVKHNNPCGAASHADLAEATRRARACDPVSAFGAVVALGKAVDAEAATVLAETFIEVVLAPSFTAEALEILAAKKSLRVLDMGGAARLAADRDLRRVSGGLLVQDRDVSLDPLAELHAAKVATVRVPTEEERRALAFNWLVAKHVRSNAIVFGHEDRVIAVGAGQMSRVDSVEICVRKAGEALRGAVVASDAFFPFRDGVDILARAGARAIVQPGGSIRDAEVIDAANEHGLAMLLTGVRHFRH